MRLIRRAAPLVLVLVMAMVPASSASAAVRQCLPQVTGDIVQADTELAGKRKALESWTAKVAKLSPALTGWQIANKKALVCRPLRNSQARGFACVASAQPCAIAQVPTLPNAPKRRLTPRPGHNVPFEV